MQNNLTREEYQALQNKRAGMFIFQASWIMAFLCMVIVNWQLRFSPNWLPEGSRELGPELASFATVALGLSLFLGRRALKAVQQDDRQSFMTQWLGMLGLGALFVLVIGYEWLVIPTGTQYAQVFRLMTGFHMVHAVVIGAYMFNVYLNARADAGRYSSADFWAVEAGVKLWYFVLVAWLLFYVVIYWI
ncbi:MAG: hypothetical protein OHK0046_19280 [Anaerolineae bacterium]